MYQVNIKVQRRENDKPISEVYLVEAISLTDIDSKLNLEFKDIPFTVNGCKEMKFNEVFETGEGTFFTVKTLVEDLDSNTLKEVFLQEASDYNQAEDYFKKNVNYGEITNINLMNYMGIIR